MLQHVRAKAWEAEIKRKSCCCPLGKADLTAHFFALLAHQVFFYRDSAAFDAFNCVDSFLSFLRFTIDHVVNIQIGLVLGKGNFDKGLETKFKRFFNVRVRLVGVDPFVLMIRIARRDPFFTI